MGPLEEQLALLTAKPFNFFVCIRLCMHACVCVFGGQKCFLLNIFNCYYSPPDILRQSLFEPQIWRFSWPASLRDSGGLKENGPIGS